MNILIDINHPAHVHYFKNFYRIMTGRGHNVIVVSRDKEIAHQLLNLYQIPFLQRGKGRTDFLGKIIYLFAADAQLYKIAKKNNIDLFLNFLHPYPSQVASIMGKPSLVFCDTEHASLHHKLTVPFATAIYTPACYQKNLGKKHQMFEGYMELSYLHPKYFTPDKKVLDLLNLQEGEKYAIVRFVSWEAIHDVGQSGISLENKKRLIKELSKHVKVFISSEGTLPEDLEPYRIRIPVDKMHDALYYSSLLFAESGTMSSEAAVLGTPAIFINSLRLGYLEEQENKYGLVTNFRSDKTSQTQAIEKAIEIVVKNDPEFYRNQQNQLLLNCTDPTELMVQEVLKYGALNAND